MRVRQILCALILAMAPIVTQAQPADGQVAQINGAEIYYTVEGTGPPLLLLHGYPLNGDLFIEQRRALSRRFQVITVDLRGFGRSVAPDAEGSIATYASDMFRLLDQLGINDAVVGGHSMGGITALEMTKTAPARVRGLLLIDTTASAPPIFEQALWLGFARQAEEVGVASLVAPIVPEMLTGEARLTRPRLVRIAEAMVLSASVNGAVGGGKALASRPDYADVLPTITVPALIIEGVEDTVTPIPLAQALHEGIADSTLLIVPGASHAANLEKSALVNQAILRWAARKQLD